MPPAVRRLLLCAAVAASASPAIIAQPRPSWEGAWIATGPRPLLDRLTITEEGVQIRWRNDQVQCEAAGRSPNMPPTIRSETFRCPSAEGDILIAVTGTPEPLILVHALFPGTPRIRTIVFTRPTASAKPAPAPTPPGALPQFPMPPPQWTLRTVLPRGVVIARDGEPLGDIFDRLRQSLGRAQIHDFTVYGIENDGFAVVARMESIRDDGKPAEERWTQGVIRAPVFSVTDYLKALFTARPGRYRVIAFLVTARTVTPGAPADKDMLNQLWRGGAGDLPHDVRQIPLPPGGRCDALVYEFFRRTDDDPPVQVSDSRLTGPQHLAGAGLWPLERLVP